MLDKKKEDIQLQCLEAWTANGGRGTFELPTGAGKTFAAFHCIKTLPKNSTVLILAETTLREKTFSDDAIAFNSFYGVDIYKDYKVSFACYQSAYKMTNAHFNIVICDEVHELCTPTRIKFIKNNKCDFIVGLSATIDGNVSYENDEETITKLQMLNSFAPVVFSYTITQAQEEKTMRKFYIYAIKHQLDTVNNNVVVQYKDPVTKENKAFTQTEYSIYSYYNKRFREALFTSNKFLIMKMAGKRANILYTLKSKTHATIKLLKHLGRTIVFGNDIETLQKIAPCISSNNSTKGNATLLEKFQDGTLNVISSFKMLKQGYNLKSLDNVIIHSYYGKSKDLIQMIGRSLRTIEGSSKIFIFVTQGTQEERWFFKMFENNQLSIIWCDNVDDCINKIKS